MEKIPKVVAKVFGSPILYVASLLILILSLMSLHSFDSLGVNPGYDAQNRLVQVVFYEKRCVSFDDTSGDTTWGIDTSCFQEQYLANESRVDFAYGVATVLGVLSVYILVTGAVWNTATLLKHRKKSR